MDHATIIYIYRHTFASRLVQGGKDINEVRIYLGHTSLAMTMRYAKYRPPDADDVPDILNRARTVKPQTNAVDPSVGFSYSFTFNK